VEGAVVVVEDFGFAFPPSDELQAAPTSAIRTRHAKARRPLTRPNVAPDLDDFPTLDEAGLPV